MLAEFATAAVSAVSTAQDWANYTYSTLSDKLNNDTILEPSLTETNPESTNNYDDNCCFVYDGSSYTYWLGTYCLVNGAYTEYNFAREDPVNDRIASYECGKNVLARFCVDSIWDECRYDHG